MTISELIQELQYAEEIAGSEAEIRFAAQPSWPFEYSINRNIITMTKEMREEKQSAEMREEGITEEEINAWLVDNNQTDENIVYLAEGSQLGYLPGDIKQEFGW